MRQNKRTLSPGDIRAPSGCATIRGAPYSSPLVGCISAHRPIHPTTHLTSGGATSEKSSTASPLKATTLVTDWLRRDPFSSSAALMDEVKSNHVRFLLQR